MVGVSVVELGIADANLDVGHADVGGIAVGESAVLSADGDGAGIANGVADEVGRKLLFGLFLIRAGFAEGSEGALKFGGHGVEKDGRGGDGSFSGGVNLAAVLSGRGKRAAGDGCRDRVHGDGSAQPVQIGIPRKGLELLS